ncbi:MAG TPA: hypothetical protein VK395_31055 [Gemmataceae bacterium]|nr:hypothetical protein [Gemmataceae bacterium]
MRIVDSQSGTSHVEKHPLRYNEPGQPRELPCFCYRHSLLQRWLHQYQAQQAKKKTPKPPPPP